MLSKYRHNAQNPNIGIRQVGAWRQAETGVLEGTDKILAVSDRTSLSNAVRKVEFRLLHRRIARFTSADKNLVHIRISGQRRGLPRTFSDSCVPRETVHARDAIAQNSRNSRPAGLTLDALYARRRARLALVIAQPIRASLICPMLKRLVQTPRGVGCHHCGNLALERRASRIVFPVPRRF